MTDHGVIGQRFSRSGILVVFMALTVLPLLSMLSTALQPQGTAPEGIGIPRNPQWHNFVTAWNAADFVPLMKSSTLIVLGVVPAAVVFATFAGYGLARFRVPGARLLYPVFLLGLTLPAVSLVTPLYYELNSMGLIDTRWALILPLVGLDMSFGVYWMRTHFLGSPLELVEAAQMDGAGTWQSFWKIQVPLAIPAISSLSILFFIWTWNQFLLALVLDPIPSQSTMAGALGAFEGQYNTNIVLLCAGSLILIVPSLIIFLIFQRSFTKALLQGAIK
jgi:raffinose/stachyose/melibiose transport system permease protein